MSTAVAVIVLNIFLTTRFSQKVHCIIERQSNPSICLPVPKATQKSEPQLKTLVLSLRENGILFVDDSPVEMNTISTLLNVRSPTKVVVRTSHGIGWEQIKPLLKELGNNGVKNVVVNTNGTN